MQRWEESMRGVDGRSEIGVDGSDSDERAVSAGVGGHWVYRPGGKRMRLFGEKAGGWQGVVGCVWARLGAVGRV